MLNQGYSSINEYLGLIEEFHQKLKELELKIESGSWDCPYTESRSELANKLKKSISVYYNPSLLYLERQNCVCVESRGVIRNPNYKIENDPSYSWIGLPEPDYKLLFNEAPIEVVNNNYKVVFYQECEDQGFGFKRPYPCKSSIETFKEGLLPYCKIDKPSLMQAINAIKAKETEIANSVSESIELGYAQHIPYQEWKRYVEQNHQKNILKKQQKLNKPRPILKSI